MWINKSVMFFLIIRRLIMKAYVSWWVKNNKIPKRANEDKSRWLSQSKMGCKEFRRKIIIFLYNNLPNLLNIIIIHLHYMDYLFIFWHQLSIPLESHNSKKMRNSRGIIVLSMKICELTLELHMSTGAPSWIKSR